MVPGSLHTLHGCKYPPIFERLVYILYIYFKYGDIAWLQISTKSIANMHQVYIRQVNLTEDEYQIYSYGRKQIFVFKY